MIAGTKIINNIFNHLLAEILVFLLIYDSFFMLSRFMLLRLSTKGNAFGYSRFLLSHSSSSFWFSPCILFKN